MVTAKDIMTTHVVTAGKDLSIFAAADLLVDNHITGLPIIDADMNLIGILSEYDVLRILKEAAPGQQKFVEDFMTKNVLTFPETASVIEIWEFFIDNPTKRRVLIVRNGKLIGVVSRRDIVKQIVKLHRG